MILVVSVGIVGVVVIGTAGCDFFEVVVGGGGAGFGVVEEGGTLTV